MLTSKKGRFSVTEPVIFKPVFEPSPIYSLFLNKEIRNNFDVGLEQIKASEKYDEIIENYDLWMKRQ